MAQRCFVDSIELFAPKLKERIEEVSIQDRAASDSEKLSNLGRHSLS